MRWQYGVTRRTLLCNTALGTAALAAGGVGAYAQPASKPPNIIFILAGCAEAQRRLKGLIEQVLLVAVALLPLHAHRVGSDCSLGAEFGPSSDATLSGYYGLG